VAGNATRKRLDQRNLNGCNANKPGRKHSVKAQVASKSIGVDEPLFYGDVTIADREPERKRSIDHLRVCAKTWLRQKQRPADCGSPPLNLSPTVQVGVRGARFLLSGPEHRGSLAGCGRGRSNRCSPGNRARGKAMLRWRFRKETKGAWIARANKHRLASGVFREVHEKAKGRAGVRFHQSYDKTFRTETVLVRLPKAKSKP